MTNEEIRKLFRNGKKIDALRELRRDGSSLNEARDKLAAIVTDDDIAAFHAAIVSRAPDPWIMTAPGIYEPLSQTKR